MLLNFSKFFTLFTSNNQKGKPYYEKAFLGYLGIMGYDITKPKSFGGATMYDTRFVGSVLNVDFFQGDTPGTGTSNMSNGYQRSEGEHVLIGTIRVHQAVAGGATLADLINSDLVPGVSTANTKNGQWSYSINGVNKEKLLPLTEFTRAVENPFSGVYELPFPHILGGQETHQFTTRFFTAPVANTVLRIELAGQGLVS